MKQSRRTCLNAAIILAGFPSAILPLQCARISAQGAERGGEADLRANLDGAVPNNLKILFEGPPDARLLLDGFEVTA
jgi:hypothetical protein